MRVQTSFEEWFATEPGWEGTVGADSVPERSELMSAVESNDLFVYFGHGGGEKFLPAKAMWQQERCAASFLMVGPSST